MDLKPIKIGDFVVGTGHPAFIIAEIGYNFNTLDEALKSIDAAMDCGVDAVKFQTFRAETVTSKLIDFPEEAGGGNQYDEFKQYELSVDNHKILSDYCKKNGIIFFSTPAYNDDADLLEELGVPVFKIGSDDLTNYPFLQYVAKKNKPMILSTGMGTMEEISGAISAVFSTGNNKLVVLQCVSNYPIKNLEIVNLRAMITMREVFGVLTGFSDHTITLSVPMAAAALGMSVYERHFTIDKNLPAPDCALSADPKEMKAIVQGIREVEAAVGDGIKRPVESELKMRKDARKSVISTRDLELGHRISKEDIIIKRPAWGIPPGDVDVLIGLTLTRPVKKDMPIRWEDLSLNG